MWSLYFKPFSLFNPSSIYWFSILFIHWMILNFHSQMFIFPPLVFYLFILSFINQKQLILKWAISIKAKIHNDYLDLLKVILFIFFFFIPYFLRFFNNPFYVEKMEYFTSLRKIENHNRHLINQLIKLKHINIMFVLFWFSVILL